MNEQPRRPLGPQPWEVVRHKLDGIVAEMELTLFRSAFSTIVKEALDASAALFKGRQTLIDEIKGEFLAIDRALAKLQPGDVCLILVDQVEEALAHIQQRVAEAQERGDRAVAHHVVHVARGVRRRLAGS